MNERKTFTIPPGHEAVRDSEGRATGETRLTSLADEQRIDQLRLVAFKSNSDKDHQAYFNAASKWFQDRHYRRLAAKPAPDAGYVAGFEACREAASALERIAALNPDYRSEQAIGIAKAALSASPADALPADGVRVHLDAAVALSASERACYRWPEDTTEHRAMRAAYVNGAEDYATHPAKAVDVEAVKRALLDIVAEWDKCDEFELQLDQGVEQAIEAGRALLNAGPGRDEEAIRVEERERCAAFADTKHDWPPRWIASSLRGENDGYTNFLKLKTERGS